MEFANPVLPGKNFPDPHVVRGNSEWIAYATSNGRSKQRNFQVAKSVDLVHWVLGKQGALAEPPMWADEDAEYWAPHVAFDDNEYKLYGSTDPKGKPGKAIFVAKSKEPTGFIAEHVPLLEGQGYAVIDPCFFRDPVTGDAFLGWGSHSQPICIAQLNSEGTGFAVGKKVYEIARPVPRMPYWSLLEGLHLRYRSDLKKYYAWLSGDSTWTRYGLIVLEADRITGPWRPVPGNGLVLRTGWGLKWPGQNCIIEDDAGQDWTAFHAVRWLQTGVSPRKVPCREMCLQKITYQQGYPQIALGRVQVTNEVPIISWAH